MFGIFETFPFWGTIVNTLGVALGGFLGVLIKVFSGSEKVKKGGVISQLPDAIMKGVSLCVLLIGVTGVTSVEGITETKTLMIVIISVVVGVIIGTLMRIDSGITALGNFIEKKTGGKLGSITQGFVTASLLFCVGAMAIVGSIESGLLLDHGTLYAKSLLDMISAIIFATTLGWGVVFSSFLVLAYQGLITVLASFLAPLLTVATTNQISAIGSLLIIALSLNMLGLTKIKVMNFIPAIFIPILLALFM